MRWERVRDALVGSIVTAGKGHVANLPTCGQLLTLSPNVGDPAIGKVM